jgi:superfamily II DNA or RNA helicase
MIPASRRENNNLASKKSYEKSLEQQFALEYEYAVVEYHRNMPNTQVWHWSHVPEYLLFESGYIHDYSRTRKERLIRKKEPKEGVNRIRDYGMDAFALTTDITNGLITYHGIQAKYYHARKVTAGDIGSFLLKLFDIRIKTPHSLGYLYSSTPLEYELADSVKIPTHPLRHILYPWKHPDGRNKLVNTIISVSPPSECDYPLRPYQQTALDELEEADGINILCIPCRMGKTLIAGNHIKRKSPQIILAIAPLKISVENLRQRLSCFLPNYSELLVDSDTDGTTDAAEIRQFMEPDTPKVIYSTYKSTMNILVDIITFDNTFILVDECHNLTGEYMEIIKQFSSGLLLSATIPEELYEELPINKIVRIPFSEGISGKYLVDYTLWIPHLLTCADGSTHVEVEIPDEFINFSKDLTAKALYLMTCMLKTGSRRCIAYMQNQHECDEFMTILKDIGEKYHGITIWIEKITSDIQREKRQEILQEFQKESIDFRVLTSVRILDEAVDLPRCDSEFISSVGEQSSDIRFFQRCQRGSTIDPKNPNKRNNIFLWADGWEKCINALQYLRDNDPEFHKKICVTDTRYDGGESIERISYENEETSRIRTWSIVKCMSLDERLHLKATVLLNFVEKEERVPKYVETVDEIKIGQLWTSITQGDYMVKIYDSVLSKNKILRSDYERVQKMKEEKKLNGITTPQQKAEKLLKFVENMGRVPKQKEIIDGVPLGGFWGSILHLKHNISLYETLLSKNTLLRENYEFVQHKKEKKKEIEHYTPPQKAEKLLEFVKREGRVPKKDEMEGFQIGAFWGSIKQKNHTILYESLLSKNDILHNDYNKVIRIKEEKQEIEQLTPQQKVERVLAFTIREGRPPIKSDIDDFKIGEFWRQIRGGAHTELYHLILSTNSILQQEYNKSNKKREKKHEKGIFTPNDKAEKLLEFVKKEGRAPKDSDEEECNIGTFWGCIIRGHSATIYKTMLSANPILRDDYIKRHAMYKENKTKEKITPEEKASKLLKFVEVNNRYPKYSDTDVDGFNINMYWTGIKQGNNRKIYESILSHNQILCDEYERSQQRKHNTT